MDVFRKRTPAFEAGLSAGQAGLTESNNPHVPGTYEHFDWTDGLAEAHRITTPEIKHADAQ